MAKKTRNELGVKTVESTIKVRRLNYIKRIQNTAEDNIARMMFSAKCGEGKPKIGRPYNSWTQMVREDVQWATGTWGMENDISSILVKENGKYSWKYNIKNLLESATENETRERIENPTLGCSNDGCGRIFSTSQALAGHANHCSFGGRIAGRSLPTVQRRLEAENAERPVARENIRQLLFRNAKR